MSTLVSEVEVYNGMTLEDGTFIKGLEGLMAIRPIQYKTPTDLSVAFQTNFPRPEYAYFDRRYSEVKQDNMLYQTCCRYFGR